MNMKKTVPVLVSAALVAALAACSGGEKPDGGTSTSSGAAGSGSKKSDPGKKYEITMLDFLFSGIPPKDGPGVKMINEKFNIDFKKEFTIYADYPQKLTTVISSGNIPDIIGFESLDANYYKWAEQGAFLALDDYIKDYPTLSVIAPDVWAPMKANGKIYSIPRYFPASYSNSIIIRKDWLDNLGLKMPTNYEELKKVAIAFTKDDPDKNGKSDTYGLVMGANINPGYIMGAYWDPAAWYHKDKDGSFIPGFISDAWKEVVAMHRELYKEGALTKDFALLTPTQYNAEFYSGKGGMYFGNPRGMNQQLAEGLLKIHPNAKLAAVPPFKAPDGSQGLTAGSGYYTTLSLSAKLKGQDDKIRRILELIDYGRTFIPLSERTPKNPDVDWIYGKEGQGYTMENGIIKMTKAEEGKMPFSYIPDNKMWPAKDKDNEYSKTYVLPVQAALAAELEKMHEDYKHYVNPIYQVQSPTYYEKVGELNKLLYDAHTKMITDKMPLSDWDKVTSEYRQTGGDQLIKEVNEGIKKIGYQPAWK